MARWFGCRRGGRWTLFCLPNPAAPPVLPGSTPQPVDDVLRELRPHPVLQSAGQLRRAHGCSAAPVDSPPHVQDSCTIKSMAIETTYTRLRDNLATVLDKVGDDHEVVIVRRRGSPDVALIPADELEGLMETAHLLRSPENARRLLTALGRVGRRKGKASTVDQLRREFGLGTA